MFGWDRPTNTIIKTENLQNAQVLATWVLHNKDNDDRVPPFVIHEGKFVSLFLILLERCIDEIDTATLHLDKDSPLLRCV
jgi:hypothetical protein